jgi:hypothetical protein
MHEIAPGIRHWTTWYPKIGHDVSSYWLPDPGILLDPLGTPDEVGNVTEIVLSNRHHRREALEAAERFEVPVRVPRTGLHEFSEDEPVEPYDFEEPFAGGAIAAYQVTQYWPDDAALHIPSVDALLIADTVVNYGRLRFVTDDLFGEDADAEKRDIKATLARLAEELEFEHLLLAHGPPIAGEGRERLREFAAS